MIKFYQFLAELTLFQGVLILIPLLLLMVLMPFYKIIFNVIKLTLSGEKPEIIYFDILFSPLISEKEEIIGAAEPDFIVSGSKATLYWQVKGVSRIDLFPVGKNLSGNSTDIVITEYNREFCLTVHGLSASVSSTISIPPNKIKSLETEKVSDINIANQFNMKPETSNFETLNQKLDAINLKISKSSIKNPKHPKVFRFTAFWKKESPSFRANPSLSKYNHILNELNKDKS